MRFEEGTPFPHKRSHAHTLTRSRACAHTLALHLWAASQDHVTKALQEEKRAREERERALEEEKRVRKEQERATHLERQRQSGAIDALQKELAAMEEVKDAQVPSLPLHVSACLCL